MAVYRIKRKNPSPPPGAKAPETERDSFPVGSAADRPEPSGAPSGGREEVREKISRSKNRSLDAYVGSGKSARRMKENGGSMVDAIYNRREKAKEDTNETDRMLLEAFSDDKALKKERKRQEKLRKKEEKRLRKLEKKGKSAKNAFDGAGSPDDYSDSLDSLENEFASDPFGMIYSMAELKSTENPPERESPENAHSLISSDGEEALSPHSVFASDDAAAQNAVPAAEDDGILYPDNLFGIWRNDSALPDEIAEKVAEEEEAEAEEKEAEAEAEAEKEESFAQVEPDVPAENSPAAPSGSDPGEPAEPETQTGTEAQASDAATSGEENGGETDEDGVVVPSAEELAAAFGKPGTEPSKADPDMAATREFRFTGMDADEIKKILEQEGLAAPAGEEAPEKPGEIRGSDLYDDSADDFADELLHAAKRSKQPEEFTDPDLAEEMTEGIKNRSVGALVCAVWSFVVMAAALYLDSACFTRIPHPAFLTPGKYGAVLILVDLQMLLISGVLIGPALISGFKSLFSGKADHNSLTAAAMSAALIYNVSLLVTSASDPSIMLFSSAGCLFGFLNALCRYLDERRLYRSFRIVASKKPKFVAKKLGTDSGEFEALKEHLPEDPDIFTVEKTNFVTNFMANSRKPSKASGAYNAAIWIVLVLAAAFGIYNLTGGAAQAFKGFALICLFGFPACGIYAVSVPLGKISRKCAAADSALIGASAVDDYSSASVISFNDTELFPASKIRVTSIRTYGETPIDRGILYAAMIFKKVGGPLSKVFA
ncbi:MAG: hypothetical protein IJV00_08660, partial [Clostridia bacterium]|nr:hypothetical protein [Clostridia bacterium]